MRILKNNLEIDFFNQQFTNDLQEMYANPERVPQEIKEQVKTIALSLADSFKEKIIDFYFANGGDDMNEENFDILMDNFDSFLTELLKKLNSLKGDKIVYLSVASMWTGVITSLERESKIANDIGLIMTIEQFLIKFLQAQREYYETLKK